MDNIPYVPCQVVERLSRETRQLLVLTCAWFSFSILAMLGSAQRFLANAEGALVLTLVFLSVFNLLFSFYYLKRYLEHRAHRRELVEKQERAIANEALLLLAEIELELNTGEEK